MNIFLNRVRNNCEKYPDRLAFIDNTRAITYAELWNESGKVSRWLTEQGMGKEDFCLIVLPKSAASMVSVLGVLRAGCAFCNLDSNYPAERILYIRNDLGAKCVIDENTFKNIQETCQPSEGWAERDPHDAAFAIYTSGSTGRPKGVLHESGNVDLLLLSLYPEQEEYEELRTCLTAPLYSVASLLLVFNCMAVASRMYMVSEYLLRDLRSMNKFLIDNKITDTFLPPSYINIYREPSPFLRHIITGAENADGIFYESGTPSILNYYSLSEAGFPLLIWQIDKRYEHTPVGVPLVPGIDLHLIDENGKRVEGAGEGEICFTNRFVRGYINLPEETAKAFRGEVFHTGDIARRDENGLYYFIGRSDFMFKISGNRVEPSEIELAFRKLTGISLCCAKGFAKNGNDFICLFYQGDLPVSTVKIREDLGKTLPLYMIPSRFVKMDEMPVTPLGKLDRKSLTLPDEEKEVRPPYKAPADEVEKKLCKAMEKALDVKNVGADDDFFQLGGSSISAMQIAAEADIEGLSVIDIYKGHTVSGIAELHRYNSASGGLTVEEREERARKQVQDLTIQQSSMFERQNMFPTSHLQTYSFLITCGALVSTKRMVNAIHTVMKHFAIFGTIFGKNEDGSFNQRYDASAVKLPEVEKVSREELDRIKAGPFPAFDLFAEPLVSIRLLKAGSELNILIVLNHIVFDGSSLQLIAQGIKNAYLGKPLQTDTYFTYVAEETHLYGLKVCDEARAYYEKNYEGIDWCKNIPQDLDGKEFTAGARWVDTTVTPKQLEKMEKRTDITRDMMFGAAILLSLAKLGESDKVLLSSCFHGRTDSIRKYANGLLARTLPIAADLSETETLADLYAGIVKQKEEGIAHSMYDWCTRKNRLYENESIYYIYETPEMSDRGLISSLGVKVSLLNSHWDKNCFISSVAVFEYPESLGMNITYAADLFSKEMIEKFVETYLDLIYKLLAVEDPSEVTIGELLGSANHLVGANAWQTC
ncbi:MAG: AMP-binding protein [Ruminococcus sp.]|nr:AMP-binding protein [Ruminococcus sp.]